jgi:hypothetical protein
MQGSIESVFRELQYYQQLDYYIVVYRYTLYYVLCIVVYQGKSTIDNNHLSDLW